MTQDHVRHLMADDTGKLRFVVADFNGGGIDEDRAARERKCVDALAVNRLYGEWKELAARTIAIQGAGVRRRLQLVQEGIQVIVYLPVVHHGDLLLQFYRRLAPKLHVLLDGEQIPTGFQLLQLGSRDGRQQENGGGKTHPMHASLAPLFIVLRMSSRYN